MPFQHSLKGPRREARRLKKKHAPRGGTLSRQLKRMEASGYYIRRSRKNQKIRIEIKGE